MEDGSTIDPPADELRKTLTLIQAQAKDRNLRVTQHGQQEMVEEDISLDEVLAAIYDGRILENYPEHRRGPCCLLGGVTDNGRPLHIVCTTAQPTLVYEPRPPKWMTPTQRGN